MIAKSFRYLSLLVLMALTFSNALAASLSGVTMKVEPHLSGHFKFGEWLPLRVTLTNDGPPVRGEVRADTTEAGGKTTYLVPVELPTGARKRITLYVQPPSFAQAVRVRLMDGTNELASQSAQVTVERNINYVVGVIATRNEAFAVLNSLALNESPADQPQNRWGGPSTPRPVKAIPIPLSDIPDRPEGLRALDALIVSGVDTSGLTPEQGRALQGWVEEGGRLILGGGAGAACTLAGLPDALAGDWRSSGADRLAELQTLDALARFAGQDVRVPGPFVGAQLPPGRALIEQNSLALLTDKRLGEGHVNYAALDLAASPFDAWAGASHFWEKLLTPDSAYPPGPQDVSLRQLRANSLSYALQNLPSLELPSIRWLAGLLAVYIVLVGPVNYLALRWLRKLEWGWITIAALTLSFSAGTFALGYAMRGGEVIINKVSIFAFNVQGAAAPVQTYVGLFSPERSAYTLSLGRALVAPISVASTPWANNPMANAEAIEIAQGEPAQVRGVQVNQWALQGFQTESPAPQGWGIESDLVFDGDNVRGTLVNRTSEIVQDVVIVNGNLFARIGDLPPGQPHALDQALQQNQGAPFPYFLYQDMGGNSGPPSREAQMRQQLVSNYYGNLKGSPQSPDRPILLGWMQTSPLDVQVVGKRWTTQQTSLVIATLSTRYLPGHVHVPSGSLLVSLVDAKGNVSPCGSKGQVYVDVNSSATLEFRLPEELANLRVTRLAWRIGTDGAPLPTVEVYTRSGEWIKQQEPELTDPARFVLAGGVVRLRVSNTGNWGGCSQYDLDVEGELE